MDAPIYISLVLARAALASSISNAELRSTVCQLRLAKRQIWSLITFINSNISLRCSKFTPANLNCHVTRAILAVKAAMSRSASVRQLPHVNEIKNIFLLGFTNLYPIHKTFLILLSKSKRIHTITLIQTPRKKGLSFTYPSPPRS